MPIDPRNSPDVNPPVDTDFGSNVYRSPYTSTTEDMLDRLSKDIKAISGGGGGSFASQGEWVTGIIAANLEEGQISSPVLWQEITRDLGGSITSVQYYNYPGGSLFTETLIFVRPVNIPACTFETFRLDGSIVGNAEPWRDALTIPPVVIPPITGIPGNILDRGFSYFKYLDVAFLPSTDGGDSILPFGEVGFWADRAKTRFYPANAVGGAVGPLALRRGSPTYEGILLQDIYIEATPGCHLEITIVR